MTTPRRAASCETGAQRWAPAPGCDRYDSFAEQLQHLAALRRALRAERERGVQGHWAYDLARHRELLHAYRVAVRAEIAQRPASKPCSGA